MLASTRSRAEHLCFVTGARAGCRRERANRKRRRAIDVGQAGVRRGLTFVAARRRAMRAAAPGEVGAGAQAARRAGGVGCARGGPANADRFAALADLAGGTLVTAHATLDTDTARH